MTLSSIGMLFSHLKWRNSSPRIGFFLKMSGGPLEFSRAVDGSTMLFIDQSHTSCFSGDH
nr:cyclin-dependent kinases regulatory subunit isoform X2 [Ipomoea batatas]GMD73606.1 cyclin-dependent kinases regulatory subunit isoform X2 [Ipomoea batatas]GME21492.1 cyclin-dependent kinases regulatory subunit isoform X2 [Ipomoea batatas]